MAIPFLQPEEDEAARHQHHATGGGGGTGPPPPVGSGSSGSAAGPSATSASGIVVGIVGPMVPGSPAIPIPGSPGPPAPSGTSTAVQTPLIGPMNGDQLVQLFYEALYRYSRGDTPSTPISQSPQSSSCSPFTTGYYTSSATAAAAFGGGGTGQVFFPQTPNGVLVPPRTPSTPAMGRAMFFGQPPTPSPSGSSSHSSQHSANSPGLLDAAGTQASSSSCSTTTAAPIFHQFPSSFSGIPGSRSMLAGSNTSATSAIWPDEGDDSSESDSSSSQPSSSAMSSSGEGGGPTGSSGSSSNLGAIGCSPHCLGLHHHHHHHPQLLDVVGGGSGSSTAMGFIPPHLDFMAGREQLQEFTGKIPQRKKKQKPGKSKKSKFLEQTLVWPTLAVTATLIALGCGLLAAR